MMDNNCQNASNAKTISIPNGTVNELISVNRVQNEFSRTDNAAHNTFLNSSRDDKNGIVSTCAKSQPSSATCSNLVELELQESSCNDYYFKCHKCDTPFYSDLLSRHNVFAICKDCTVLSDNLSNVNAYTNEHYLPSINEMYTDSDCTSDDDIENYVNPPFLVLNSIWDDYEIVDENLIAVAQGLTIQTTTTNMSSQELPENNHVSLGDLDKKNTCNQCDRSFKREKAFLSHLKLHQDNSAEESDSALLKPLNSYKKEDEIWNKSKFNSTKHYCSCCHKSFPTKQKLKSHMRVHRKKTFICEICATCFQKEQDLNGHRLTTHQSTSGYCCSECGKSFSSRQGLWEHNRLHRSKHHSYRCTQCSKTFSSKQGYYIHIRIHSNERPYKCHYCKKAFRDGGTLRKHERIHTGLRPHVCPICSKAFNQKVVLREHLRSIHVSNWKTNKDNIFQCTLCDFGVLEKNYLCAHLIKHGDNLPETDNTTVVSEENNVSDNNEGFEDADIEGVEDFQIDADDVNVEDKCTVHKCELSNNEFLNMKDL